MVTHVNDSLAAISRLEYQLVGQITEVSRAQEMILRLAMLDPQEQVSESILNYMCEYSSICRESLMEATEEGMSLTVDTGGSTSIIKKIFVGLKNAIVRIFETVKNIFRYLFDSQYRHRKQFVDINRDLIRLAANTTATAKFESIPCAVLPQASAMEVLDKSAALVNFIRMCSQCTSHEALDALFRQFSGIGGITVQDDKFTDVCFKLEARKFNSFKDAGWTIDGLQKVIGKQIDVISGVESLKEAQAQFEREAKKLERGVDAQMNRNASSDEIQISQRRIAMLIRITKIIAGAVVVLTERTKAITNIVKGIDGEAIRIMQESGLK